MDIRIPEDVIATADSKRLAMERAEQEEREAERRWQEEVRERFARMRPDVAFVVAWAKALTEKVTLPHLVSIVYRPKGRSYSGVFIEPDGQVCRRVGGNVGVMGGSQTWRGRDADDFARVDAEEDFRAARQAIESGEVWDSIRKALAKGA